MKNKKLIKKLKEELEFYHIRDIVILLASKKIFKDLQNQNPNNSFYKNLLLGLPNIKERLKELNQRQLKKLAIYYNSFLSEFEKNKNFN